MAGINPNTGKVVSNYQSALFAVNKVFSTRLRSRFMKREFGGGCIELLGRAITPQLFSTYQVLMMSSVDVWCPRFRTRKIIFTGSVNEIRMGRASFEHQVDWRPRGHLGDFTVESIKTFGVNFTGQSVEVI